ncbi:MAG: tRNA (guanosine(37)-N1)-methyltransferase TrmD [Deltaproteobacteria bacterium]|nr:tRNA (guanosine(37)-N1)-methyltransferase TrmD [Deltaproteobacteria bacterium]
MRFDVLTLFPGLFPPYLDQGVLGRGIRDGLVSVEIHDIRDEGEGKHRTVDDVPFGGGAGMVMKPGPIVRWIRRLETDGARHTRVVLLSPQGPRLTNETAMRLAGEDRIILVCGRYEGIDDRVREHFVDEEVSIGDYVLTGGELPALVLLDVVSRFVPGVVGNDESVRSDSLYDGLLKYPQYTQPRDFEGIGVPDVLLSGDHGRIAAWRREATLRRTASLRPDLLDRAKLTESERAIFDASVHRNAGTHEHLGGGA